MFLNELFTSEEGEERDIIERDDGGYFVLRLDEVIPSALRPLDEVRGEVAAHWRSTQLATSLRDKAEALVARLDDGELLAVIADELGVEIQTEGPKPALPAGLRSRPNWLRASSRRTWAGPGFQPRPGRRALSPSLSLSASKRRKRMKSG